MFLAGSAAVVVAACSDDDTTGSTDLKTTTPATTIPETAIPETTIPESTIPETTVPATTIPATTTSLAPIELSGDPFTLGVASGDPDSTSIVLWTRLAPDPLDGGGMPSDDVEVTWELGTDETFAEIVATGVITAEAAHAHSVHVIVTPPRATDGLLTYRFRVGQYTSAVGRTKLAPAGSASLARFVSASCQNYQDGFYAAHRDIAEQQPDFVLWLGDYIYEGGAATVGEGAAVRSHLTPEPMDLDGYRNRYALYKSDLDLQAAHHACPWLIVWDDHEVENNYAAEIPQDTAEASAFVARRLAAYTAWWEHQPVRLDPPQASGEYRIYRDAQWGDLVGITLLDTRQYRTDQACGDITLSLDPACPETFDDDRTLTGDEQEQWLFDTVGSHGTTWNVIAQQVVMSNLTLNGAVLNFDQWDGYPANRDRVLRHLADAEVPNVIVLSGDIHLAGIGILRDGEPGIGQAVAVEFVDTSISSSGLIDPAVTELVKSFPDIVDVELAYRGYTLHTVTPTDWSAEYRIVEAVTDPESRVTAYKTYVVDEGAAAVRSVG